DREEDRVEQREAGRLVLVGPLEVEGRASAVLAGVRILLLVDLAERALDERGGSAEEAGDPHPEHGAGAAEGDRGGDAADVAMPTRPDRDIIRDWKEEVPSGETSPFFSWSIMSGKFRIWSSPARMVK